MHCRIADLDSPTDAQAVVALLDAYAADPLGAGAPLDPSVKARLISALREVPGRLVLLAFVDGEAVGVLVAFQGFSTFKARPLLNIHDLAVLPGYRGRGIGRGLLAAAEAEARRRGCCKLTLEVREDNPAAGLYARCGFGPGLAEGRAAPHRFLEKRL